MDKLEATAHRIFPGSTVLARHDFESAKERLLTWIRAQKDWLEPVDRWALACEACQQVWLRCEPPVRDWAIQLRDGELATMLAALHSSGFAREFTSSDPTTWARRPRFRIPPTVGSLRRQQILSEIGCA